MKRIPRRVFIEKFNGRNLGSLLPSSQSEGIFHVICK